MKVEENVCPYCGAQIQGDGKFCTWCGSELDDTWYAPEYQQSVPDEPVSNQICSYCQSNDVRIQVESAGVEGYQRTMAVCRNCGYSWVVSSDLPELNESVSQQTPAAPYQENVSQPFNGNMGQQMPAAPYQQNVSQPYNGNMGQQTPAAPYQQNVSQPFNGNMGPQTSAPPYQQSVSQPYNGNMRQQTSAAPYQQNVSQPYNRNMGPQTSAAPYQQNVSQPYNRNMRPQASAAPYQQTASQPFNGNVRPQTATAPYQQTVSRSFIENERPQPPAVPYQQNGSQSYNGNVRQTPSVAVQTNVTQNYNYYPAGVTYMGNEIRSSKDKTIALLLCIFLGYFGVHHFYAGKIGLGLLYLFTSGLCGIGWFVDIILILTGSYKDGDGRPIK